MNTPHSITYPLVLSSAALAYLLALLEVPQLLGVDDATLFPSDQAARDATFSAGKSYLESEGWLTWQADQHAYHLDEALLAIITSLAFPVVVMVVTLDTPPTPRRGVTCTISNDLVIEVARFEDTYHLNVLASVDLLVQRLVHVLELPPQHGTVATYTLARPTFEAIRRDPQNPVQLALPPTVAEHLITTLTTLTCSAVIAFLQVRQSQVTALHLIGVLVGRADQAWMVQPAGEASVQLTALGRDDLAASLLSNIVALQPAA